MDAFLPISGNHVVCIVCGQGGHASKVACEDKNGFVDQHSGTDLNDSSQNWQVAPLSSSKGSNFSQGQVSRTVACQDLEIWLLLWLVA
jgi:hypothetical protein